MRPEASCASVVRAAKGFVEDVGSEAASRSAGLLDLACSSDKNAERDCNSVMVKKFKLALPILTSTLDVSPNTEPSVPLLKLRDWARYLIESNNTHLLVGLTKPCWEREAAILRKFWSLFERQEPNHPIFREATSGNLRLSHTFPMLLHGDEGRGRKRSAFLVLNFHSVVGRGLTANKRKTSFHEQTNKKQKKKHRMKAWTQMRPNYIGHTFTSRFLFAALPKVLYTGKHEHIWDALLRSAAEEAKYMFGTGVEDGMHGRGRFHMAVLRICGDWPWLTDSGGLMRSFRHVQKHKTRSKPPVGVCHKCMAGQIGFDFEEINTLQPKWLATMYSQNLFGEDAEPSPLSQIPHSVNEMASLWTFDIFHTVHLGIGRCFLASILVLLSELEPESNIDDRFQSLTDDYLSWCKRSSRRAHVQKLSKELVGYPTTRTYPNGTWHKGDLTTVLMGYAQYRYEKDGSTWSPMLQLAGRAAVCLNKALSEMYSSDAWLSPGEARSIGNAGMDFLKAYSRLARMALNQGLTLWVLQPKHHAFHHLMLYLILGSNQGPVLNIVCFGTQADEDFIGRPSRLSRRVTAMPEQCCKRVVSRYLQNCWSQWVKAGYIVRPKATASA